MTSATCSDCAVRDSALCANLSDNELGVLDRLARGEALTGAPGITIRDRAMLQ